MADDQETTYQDFKKMVNMTAATLKNWLQTDDAKSVGVKQGTTSDKKTSSGGIESTGHASGERIVAILEINKSDLTDDDYAHMRKVNAYIKRHLAQEPSKEEIKTSRWRYSLMNWGHDPLG